MVKHCLLEARRASSETAAARLLEFIKSGVDVFFKSTAVALA